MFALPHFITDDYLNNMNPSSTNVNQTSKSLVLCDATLKEEQASVVDANEDEFEALKGAVQSLVKHKHFFHLWSNPTWNWCCSFDHLRDYVPRRKCQSCFCSPLYRNFSGTTISSKAV